MTDLRLLRASEKLTTRMMFDLCCLLCKFNAGNPQSQEVNAVRGVRGVRGVRTQYCSLKPVRPEPVEGLVPGYEASTSSARTDVGSDGVSEQHWVIHQFRCAA